MNPLRNEKGFSILLLALIILLTMTAIGIAMLQTTQRELRSVTKLKLSTQAFYSAESGVNLVVAELNSGTWSEFDDQLNLMNDASAIPTDEYLVLTQDDYPGIIGMTFSVQVSFVGSGTDILCWGDLDGDFDFEQHTLQEFRNATGKVAGEDFWPILIITGIGEEGHVSGGLFKYAKRSVQILVRLEPSFVFPEAALTLNGSLINNGTPQSSIGDGHPDDTVTCGVDDIVGTNDSILGYTGNTDICEDAEGNKTACTGTPDTTINPDGYPVDEVASMLVGIGTELGEDDLKNGATVGSEDDPNAVYYYRGDIDTGINNLTGYGILVIVGNLALGGNIDWDGMLFITGDLTLNGGGNPSNYIHGSVIVGGNVTGNGNPDIYFDCEGMIDLWESSGQYRMKWWKQL